MKVPKSPEEVEVEAVFSFHPDKSENRFNYDEGCVVISSPVREISTLLE